MTESQELMEAGVMTSVAEMRTYLKTRKIHTFGLTDIDIERIYTLAVSPIQVNDIVNKGGYLYKVIAVHDDGTADVHRLVATDIERLDLSLFLVHSREQTDSSSEHRGSR